MQKGNLLPDVKIINFEGSTTSSNIEFKGQKTFIYFWSQTQMNHYRRTIRRVEELKTLYPDYRFVGICIQPYTDMVSQAQNILNLDLTNQYSFENFEKSSKSWVLTFLNKTIIIDEKSNIIDGFSNLFTNDLSIIPGSVIYVPREIGKLDGLNYASVIAPIFSSLAISLASLNSISD